MILWAFFHCLEVNHCKNNHRTNSFSYEIKSKLKTKVSKANINIQILSGFIIKFNPNRKDKYQFFVAYKKNNSIIVSKKERKNKK